MPKGIRQNTCEKYAELIAVAKSIKPELAKKLTEACEARDAADKSLKAIASGVSKLVGVV